MKNPFIATLALLAAALPSPAMAQGRATVTIGTVTSEQNCELYRAWAGRRSVYADPYVYASSTTWITWFYRDCVDHFQGIRTALQAALASSGKLAVGGGGYVLSANVSGVSGSGGPAAPPPATGPEGYWISSSSMMVNLDFTLKDRSGRIIFGDLVTKKLETGSDVTAKDFRATSSMSGPAAYAALQRAVSLAVARKVAFRLVPMEVVANQGKNIQLNYGAPLLEMGMLVQVTSPDGGTVVKYRVSSASGGSALAEPYSDGDRSQIVPGSRAIALEPEDPASNGRRFDRVDLP